MKVYVLTEIDQQSTGFNPKSVRVFSSLDAANEKMREMLEAAKKKYGESNAIFEDKLYAGISSLYYLDIFAPELSTDGPDITTVQELSVVAELAGVRDKLMDECNMSREGVWELMRGWAAEFDKEYAGYDYAANNTSFYDEVDKFVQKKKAALDMPELHADDIVEDDVEFYNETFFGKDALVTVHLHIQDGFAEGDGIRVEYPRLAELTREQIAEIDDSLGGRIKDSGFVCPHDVLLKYGNVVSFTGIMGTTNGHIEDQVRRINVAWIYKKDKFRPILCALYERDIDEITDADSFRIPVWEEWPEYHHGCNTNDWSWYNARALSEMQANWVLYANNYLMHIANGKDLDIILKFINA